MKELLEDAVETLTFARQGTIREARNIPLERWDFRPHENAKSVSEVLYHVIEAGLMLVGEAADPEGDFLRRSPDEHVAAHVGLPEEMSDEDILAALDSSLDTCVARIRGADEDHWAGTIRRFDGKRWTRLTYLFYAASHEQYHCGQLAIYARSMGLVPALTQMIHGDDAK